MGIVATIQSLFGASPERQGNTSQPDIRYADPSHAQMNERIKAGTHVKEQKVSKVTKPLPQKKHKSKPAKVTFDTDEIAEKIIIFLKKSEYKKGAPHKNLKAYVWACVKGNLWKQPKSFETAFQSALNKLKAKKKIGFHKDKRLWKLKPKIKKVELHPLSEKELAYFKDEGLGEGWYRLRDGKTGRDAIKWIHQNYNWEEFEKFCCDVLTHVGIKNAKLSEKDPETGADGGVDGYGTLFLDGKDIPITIQAKRYNPDYKLGVKDARDFVAATQAKNVIRGFLVCTCDLTPDARQHILDINASEATHAKFEIIDQTRLIECMIHRANSVHGYGLHKTDDLGIYYLNPQII
jgi:hypothetical protein